MDIKELIKDLNKNIVLVNRVVTVKQLLEMDIAELERVGELVGIELNKINANPLKKDNETYNKLNMFLKILKEIYNAKVELIDEEERRKELEEQIKKVKELLDEKEESRLRKAKRRDLEQQLNELINELKALK